MEIVFLGRENQWQGLDRGDGMRVDVRQVTVCRGWMPPVCPLFVSSSVFPRLHQSPCKWRGAKLGPRASSAVPAIEKDLL